MKLAPIVSLANSIASSRSTLVHGTKRYFKTCSPGFRPIDSSAADVHEFGWPWPSRSFGNLQRSLFMHCTRTMLRHTAVHFVRGSGYLYTQLTGTHCSSTGRRSMIARKRWMVSSMSELTIVKSNHLPKLRASWVDSRFRRSKLPSSWNRAEHFRVNLSFSPLLIKQHVNVGDSRSEEAMMINVSGQETSTHVRDCFYWRSRDEYDERRKFRASQHLQRLRLHVEYCDFPAIDDAGIKNVIVDVVMRQDEQSSICCNEQRIGRGDSLPFDSF